jgi:shikimate dehydrogenase
MKLYGLIGYPLTHSWSAAYFSSKFQDLLLTDHEYRLFPLRSLIELQALLTNFPGISGLNVTIPYKISVLPLLYEVSQEAQAINAVNCIKVNSEQGKFRLTGFNTDAWGFRQSLIPLIEKHHEKALVLGTGGASHAVVFVLNQMGIQSTLVSRNPVSGYILNYSHLTEQLIYENTLIINTTPLGMFPELGTSPPIPYHFLGNRHLLFDLVYNPEETVFLKKGREAGAKTKNGLEMLQLQAEESWKIWNSK